MDVLWITPKWPFPVADGARIATTQLVKNLCAQGFNVHLCALVPDSEVIAVSEAEKELGTTQVTLVRRPKASRFRQLLSLFTHPFFPVTLSPYRDKMLTEQMLQLLQTQNFDWVIYDGLHSASWRLAKTQVACSRLKEIYRAHNVESDIWFRAAKDAFNPLKKLLLFFQGHLVKLTETALVAACDFTLPVSFADEAIFATYPKHGVLHTAPIGIQVEPLSPKQSAPPAKVSRNILFVGKLDWPPNRDGLKWILEKVWPEAVAKANDLTLSVVGSGERNWLEKYRSLPGLKIIGEVKELAPHYENCTATLVPVFYGSGTRVKAIESSLYGRICISTEVGVEGLGLIAGRTYLKAENASEWISILTSLAPSTALAFGREARAYAETIFNPSLIAKNLIIALNHASGSAKE